MKVVLASDRSYHNNTKVEEAQLRKAYVLAYIKEHGEHQTKYKG